LVHSHSEKALEVKFGVMELGTNKRHNRR